MSRKSLFMTRLRTISLNQLLNHHLERDHLINGFFINFEIIPLRTFAGNSSNIDFFLKLSPV